MNNDAPVFAKFITICLKRRVSHCLRTNVLPEPRSAVVVHFNSLHFSACAHDLLHNLGLRQRIAPRKLQSFPLLSLPFRKARRHFQLDLILKPPQHLPLIAKPSCHPPWKLIRLSRLHLLLYLLLPSPMTTWNRMSNSPHLRLQLRVPVCPALPLEMFTFPRPTTRLEHQSRANNRIPTHLKPKRPQQMKPHRHCSN